MIFDKSMTKEETLVLINTCDTYISLHRAEGLTMIEAISMGK